MKQNMRGLTCAILSISLLTVMAGAAMAPALGAIKEHFANCSPMTGQLIVSLPALFIILTTFLFRPLCRLMRTRTLALTGLLVFLLCLLLVRGVFTWYNSREKLDGEEIPWNSSRAAAS